MDFGIQLLDTELCCGCWKDRVWFRRISTENDRRCTKNDFLLPPSSVGALRFSDDPIEFDLAMDSNFRGNLGDLGMLVKFGGYSIVLLHAKLARVTDGRTIF